MSGHSKWNNIKRKKEKTDGARAKIFTKIGRELAVAVKEGGSADPAANSKLKDVIAKAKANNVPNDNIERIIKKAAGEGNSNAYESITYEGYGPAGVAVIVECLTDNRNRTAGDVRHYFDKFGGNLGTTGCVSFMFNEKGVIVLEREGLDEDTVMSDALEAGASDFRQTKTYSRSTLSRPISAAFAMIWKLRAIPLFPQKWKWSRIPTRISLIPIRFSRCRS